MTTVRLSAAERQLVLEVLYEKLGQLITSYSQAALDRRPRQQLRLRVRALARLIAKLEGSQALDVEGEP